MRSIRYRLGGDPHNLDDCLHYTKNKEKPSEVSIELCGHERLTQYYTLRQFVGRFSWKFPNKEIFYEEVFEGYFVGDGPLSRESLAMDAANKGLEGSIAEIEKEGGIEVTNRDARFDHNLRIEDTSIFF